MYSHLFLQHQSQPDFLWNFLKFFPIKILHGIVQNCFCVSKISIPMAYNFFNSLRGSTREKRPRKGFPICLYILICLGRVRGGLKLKLYLILCAQYCKLCLLLQCEPLLTQWHLVQLCSGSYGTWSEEKKLTQSCIQIFVSLQNYKFSVMIK